MSETDPDANLSEKSGEYKALNYNTHHKIDADSRVIVDCHITIGTQRNKNSIRGRRGR